MPKHKVCETEIISESPSCTISRCRSCNTYHLHIGPMSLRLNEEMFNNLSNTILNAQWVMQQESEHTLHQSMHH